MLALRARFLGFSALPKKSLSFNRGLKFVRLKFVKKNRLYLPVFAVTKFSSLA